MKKMRPLKPQELLFCAEYAKDKNATKAAIRAGYDAARAKQKGNYLMRHPAIKAHLMGLNVTNLTDLEHNIKKSIEEAGSVHRPATVEAIPPCASAAAGDGRDIVSTGATVDSSYHALGMKFLSDFVRLQVDAADRDRIRAAEALVKFDKEQEIKNDTGPLFIKDDIEGKSHDC